MATFSLQNFKSEVLRRGVAKPNRFEVQILVPFTLQNGLTNAKLVSLFCENAVLPTYNVGVVPQRIYGPNYQNPQSVEFGGEAITLSFLVDQKMVVKKFFDDWMRLIVNPNTYHVSYRKNNSGQSNYTSEIKISQLDERDIEVYNIVLEDAFPRNIGIMDLNMASINTPHKLNVTFAYRRWRDTSITTRDREIADAADRAVRLGIAT